MATNQVSEQELQFRKRARRRLVGAVALVLLMVTVLPMVLDDREAKAPHPDIAITIPSQDGGDFTSKIVPVAPQETPAPVKLASPLEKPKADVPPPTPKPEQVVAKPAPVASPEPVAKPSTEKPAETASKAVDSESAPKPVAKPAASKPAPVAAPKAAAKKGSFSVQIGVFGESDKLKQLESKLAAKGFHPTREAMDTPKGPKIRLRVGPYANKADAEAALAKLKAAEVAGMIVTNK